MLNRKSEAAISASPGTALAVIGTIPCNGSILSFDVSNGGSVALNAFEIRARAHPSSLTYQTYINGTNWTDSTNSNVMKASGALATLGSNTAGFAHVRVHANYDLQFLASVGSGTTLVTVNPSFTDAE